MNYPGVTLLDCCRTAPFATDVHGGDFDRSAGSTVCSTTDDKHTHDAVSPADDSLRISQTYSVSQDCSASAPRVFRNAPFAAGDENQFVETHPTDPTSISESGEVKPSVSVKAEDVQPPDIQQSELSAVSSITEVTGYSKKSPDREEMLVTSLLVEKGTQPLSVDLPEQSICLKPDDESVDEMMARYRRQTEEARIPSASSSACQHTNPVVRNPQFTAKFVEDIRQCVKRGLCQIFSHPLTGPVAIQLLCDEVVSNSLGTTHHAACPEDYLLILFLQACLAEAESVQEPALSAIIGEAICLLKILLEASGDASTVCQGNQLPSSVPTPTATRPKLPISVGLLEDVRSDQRNYAAYGKYLAHMRIRAVSLKHHLQFLKARSERQLQLHCNVALHDAISRFMDTKLRALKHFYSTFVKCRDRLEQPDGGRSAQQQLVWEFVHDLCEQWMAHPHKQHVCCVPQNDPEFGQFRSILDGCKSHIEQLVMDKIYKSGIWMNDAQMEREKDLVFYRELAYLRRTLSAAHTHIPERFHVLLPFEPVQSELLQLDRYHLPSEMIRCLDRVVQQILACLGLVSPDAHPGADVILPVLVYVIIQTNPPNLLSNMAFIETFAGTLQSKDEYIWCQFRAAVAEVRRLLSVVSPDCGFQR
ncbi:unnamed protein product [Dicrocoelium dendriticum]|nr:unnamed protein product [Dicrocoelium dendriticum]